MYKLSGRLFSAKRKSAQSSRSFLGSIGRKEGSDNSIVSSIMMDDTSTHHDMSVPMANYLYPSNPPDPSIYPIPMEILCAGSSSNANDTSMDTSDSNFSRVSLPQRNLDASAFSNHEESGHGGPNRAFHADTGASAASGRTGHRASAASSDSETQQRDPIASEAPTDANGRVTAFHGIFGSVGDGATAGYRDDEEELVYDGDDYGQEEEDTTGTTVARAAPRQSASFEDVDADTPQQQRMASAAGNLPPNGTNEPPSPTSRKKPKRPRLADNVEIFMYRRSLFHICPEELKKYIPDDVPDKHYFWGKNRGKVKNVVGNRYWIELEIFPHSSVEINKPNVMAKVGKRPSIRVDRNKFKVAYEGERDLPQEHFVEVFDDDERAKGDRDPKTKSTREFTRKTDEEVLREKFFTAKYDTQGRIEVKWGIVPEDEGITLGEGIFPRGPPELQGIDWDKSAADIFFENFFPSLDGVAKKMDKFNWDIRRPNRQTVIKENIKFHDPFADDPDWKVKQCILLCIKGCLYRENGVENLWPSGVSPADIPLPGFIEWCPESYFWAFIISFPFAFCDEKYWYKPTRDVPFECFDPMVEEMNEKRRALFKDAIRLLIVDETMCPWLPKKTKTGGLPKLIFIPHKPHDFGLLLRNAMEAITCIMMEQECVKDPEIEDLKEYANTVSHMPDGSLVPHHVADAMRLAKNAGLKKNDWETGDSYFGGVETVVELMKVLGIHSTFVVKNKSKWFPSAVLSRIMSARHGDRKLGHWVVMTTEISGVKIMAIAWSWHPDQEPAYYVSSCGSTAPSHRTHLSEIATGIGPPDTKLIPQPSIVAGVLAILSVIDEHNKKHCRRELPLYESWPTKHPWFRAVCCLIGQSVVDEFHAYKQNDPANYQDKSVIQFAEVIVTGSLREWPREYSGSLQRQRPGAQNYVPGQRELVRITDEDGNPNYPLTDKDKARGRLTGRGRDASCWICRKYQPKYNPTTYCCKDCGTPICHKDRSREPGRNQKCRSEHWYSPNLRIRCNGKKKNNFDDDLKLYH